MHGTRKKCPKTEKEAKNAQLIARSFIQKHFLMFFCDLIKISTIGSPLVPPRFQRHLPGYGQSIFTWSRFCIPRNWKLVTWTSSWPRSIFPCRLFSELLKQGLFSQNSKSAMEKAIFSNLVIWLTYARMRRASKYWRIELLHVHFINYL